MFASNAAGVFAANHRIGAVLAVLAHAVGVLDADCLEWLAFVPVNPVGTVAAQRRAVVAAVFVCQAETSFVLMPFIAQNACTYSMRLAPRRLVIMAVDSRRLTNSPSRPGTISLPSFVATA